MAFEIGHLTRLPLGMEGENNARVIEIDMSDWLADYPGASVGLLLMRPGEDSFYPAVTKTENGVMRYIPTRADVEIPGEGLAQIVLTGADDVELRSRVVKTKIEESLPGSAGEAPEEPMQPFVDQVLDAADRAEKAAKDAEEHKLDGFSPIAKVESTAAGAVVTITDRDGTTSVTLTEGVDGKDGKDGEDGVSPVVSVSKSGGVTTLTIVDATGTKTAKINDGAAGADGKDGYTPIKNIDYFDGKDGSAGKDGDPGDPGVYVGESEPTDPDVKVWVNPNGETHLPIASADTLGGVKVGAGLEVAEDGTVGVVPEKYQLIETIVVEEDVLIDRTKEPDGTPYNFTAVTMRIKKDIGVSYPSSFSLQACFDPNGNRSQPLYVPQSTSTTEELWCYAEVRQYKGLWERECASAWSIRNYTATPMLVKVPMYDNPVKGDETIVRLRSTNVAYAGTTIEIWGVRANA